jgi:hypothetical protein
VGPSVSGTGAGVASPHAVYADRMPSTAPDPFALGLPEYEPRAGVRDKVHQRLIVADLGTVQQPRFAAVVGDRIVSRSGSADLGDALRAAPGSYILKPRLGSNGFGVVRVISHPNGRLTVETDCPDTTRYLDEFPADSRQRGRDLVIAAATHRHRFLDRARAGLPEWALNLSILEDEIPQDRADGSFFEPRVVVQRVTATRLAVLGAMCKRIGTAVGAVVVRDFVEEPLDVSLHQFLRDRAPGQIERTRADILAAGDRVRAAIEPYLEAGGTRVHQLGIDFRLCWDAATGRAAFPLIEVQVGIGRVEGDAARALAGYNTPAELRSRFGPEAG